jgi:hypothetical protein
LRELANLCAKILRFSHELDHATMFMISLGYAPYSIIIEEDQAEESTLRD